MVTKATITNAAHISPSTLVDYRMGDIGPFIDSNGNLYVVAETTAVADALGVFKSTNDGTTWSEVDTTNRPAAITGDSLIGLAAWSVFQVGSVLHIGAVGGRYASGMDNVFDVEYHTFNMSDAGSNPDTWQITNEAVVSPSIAAANSCVDIAVRSDGDVIITHQIADDSVMGNPVQRVGYSRREGGSWTTSVSVGSGDSDQRDSILCTLGTNDRIHLFWRTAGVGEARTLRPDNSLSTTIGVGFTVGSRPMHYTDGATERVIRIGDFFSGGRNIASGNLIESSNDIASPGSSNVIENVGNTVEVINKPPARIPGDDESHAFWGAGGSQPEPGLRHATRTGTGSWSGHETLDDLAVSVFPHYLTNPTRIGYVHCSHSGTGRQLLPLYYSDISSGAVPPEFEVEQATEENVAEDVSFIDPTIFFAEPTSEANAALDVTLEAGLGLNVEQAFERTTAYDVEFFSGEAPPEGLIIIGTVNDDFIVSDDGIDWSIRPQSATTRNLRGIEWSADLEQFVVGLSGATSTADVMISADAFSWTIENVASIQANVNKIAWSPEEQLYVATRSALVYTSPDGQTWTQRSLPRHSLLGDLIWVPDLSLFVLGQDVFSGSLEKGINTSPDGINWTAVGPDAFNNFWGAFAWSPELGLIVGAEGVGDSIWTSPNGSSWTFRVSTSEDFQSAIAWGPEAGQFVLGLGLGKVFTSSNGTSWTVRTTPLSGSVRSVAWIPYIELFVISTSVGEIATSPDGINWTERTSPTSTLIDNLAWGVSIPTTFNAEHTTEQTTAFDVVFTATPTEMFAEQAFEENTAFDVTLETTEVILIEATISMAMEVDVVLTLEERQAAQGLGVPRQGDHKPSIYNPDHRLVKR